MALTGKVGGAGFDPVPADQYIARCVRVVDLGSEHNTKWDKLQRKVRITFELPDIVIESGEYEGMPRVISSKFTLSMAPKSHLRPQLESWRGRAFTDQEAEDFDILTLVGAPCIINVIHNDAGGNTYANVATITPLMKGMVCPDAKTSMYGFALTHDDFNQEIFDSLHEKTQEQIKGTPEYAALQKGPAQEYENTPEAQQGFDPNDDVPF